MRPLIGCLVLDEALVVNEWVGIAVIVTSNLIVTLLPGRSGHG